MTPDGHRYILGWEEPFPWPLYIIPALVVLGGIAIGVWLL